MVGKFSWRPPTAGAGKKDAFTLDKHQGIVTYNGLESILNSCNYDDESGTSRTDDFTSDSLDEEDSYSSSSKTSGSFSSQSIVNKQDRHGLDETEGHSKVVRHIRVKETPSISTQFSDVETMKEIFSKLLLGEDVTGGCNGKSTALALSSSITNLAGMVFGELWKLEPLSEERKSKWQREMSWFLSPANYMIELVPAEQYCTNGRCMEIMRPRVRSDIEVRLPALQKLDSVLLETLDSMVNTEFWYVERGSRAEGRTKTEKLSKRWWLPSPQVPIKGLSVSGRKKLLYHAKVVDQVFKAAKLINNMVLLEMPIPTMIKDALPKSGRESLGEELYRVLSSVSSLDVVLASLNFQSEHKILQCMNQLEAAILVWKQKIIDLLDGKSPRRHSCSLMRTSASEFDKTEFMLERAESLLQILNTRFPNLPPTFIDATKVQYNKDIGHSILEAYSRAVGNLAFSILCRIGDILQEDDLSQPNSPSVTCHSRLDLTGLYDTSSASGRLLIRRMNMDDGKYRDSELNKSPLNDFNSQTWLMPSTPSRSRVWCIGKETCRTSSCTNSP